MFRPGLKSVLFSELKVLIVDDSRTDRAIVTSMLRKAGFVNIREAVDGRDGLDIAMQWQPDFIVLDTYMPFSDGAQVARTLRDQKNDAVIIMQTASTKSETRTLAFESGVDDFLHKPIDMQELVLRARAHLDRRQLTKEIHLSYQRIQEELVEASVLQHLLLPSDTIIEKIKNDHGYEIATYFHPTSELSGDYISIRYREDGTILLVMADVAGHGVTSALYAFALHTLLEDRLLKTLTPGDALAHINRCLLDLVISGKLATMFYGVIDPKNHCLSYASAASPPPLMIRNGAPHVLDGRGFLMGALQNASYTTHHTSIAKGDMLLLYSDALIEIPTPQGIYIQEGDLFHELQRCSTTDTSECMHTIVSGFFANRPTHLSDDLSIMLVRF